MGMGEGKVRKCPIQFSLCCHRRFVTYGGRGYRGRDGNRPTNGQLDGLQAAVERLVDATPVPNKLLPHRPYVRAVYRGMPTVNSVLSSWEWDAHH